MNYRIEEKKEQKFIALVRAFDNEKINDETNHDIPDFWGECNAKHLVDEIMDLRPDGKKASSFFFDYIKRYILNSKIYLFI